MSLTMYSPKGKECKVDLDQVEIMKEAGYTSEKPKVEKEAEKEAGKANTNKQPSK